MSTNFKLNFLNPGLFRTHFPYVLEKIHKYEGHFLLNRYYSCLGTPSQDLRNVMPIHLTKPDLSALKKVATIVQDGGGAIYFYDDSCPPWEGQRNFNAYMNRLGILAQCRFFKKDTLAPWYTKEDESVGNHTLPDPPTSVLMNVAGERR